MVNFFQSWGALILSGISLLVAILSFIKSTKSQNLQNKVNDLECQIKQYELENIKKEKKSESLSCVEASVMNSEQGKYRLHIQNSGNTTVYNVTAKFDEETNFIICDGSKMPFEELEPKKNFEILFLTYWGCPSKFKIITEWTDSNGKQHSKKQMNDL